MTLLSLLAAIAIGAALPDAARAQALENDGFELQNLHLSTRQRHSHAAFPVAGVPDEFTWEAGAFLQFAQNGLQLGDDALVKSQILANIWGSVAVAGRVEFGLELPLYLLQTTDLETFSGPGSDPTAGIGDPRVTGKFLLFDTGRPENLGFAMSLGADLFVPLGNEDNFQGESIRGEFSLLNSIQIPGGYRVSAKLGYYARPEANFRGLNVDDMITYGLGVLMPLTDSFELDVATFGGVVVTAGDELGTEDAPLEGLLTARYLSTSSGFFLQGSVGTGFVSGFGAPTVRAGLAVGIGTSSVKDSDRDGIPDSIDECPNEPEDFDGFLDEDGCPDEDNDRDGVPDAEDRCPNRKGPAENEGCPSDEPAIIDYRPPSQRRAPARDADGDGIPDIDDLCPDEPEDFDGYQDGDGCPDGAPSEEPPPSSTSPAPAPNDRDGDGIIDEFDFCPDEPEDFDGILDDDGCPEDDADYDGIPDEEDACPMIGADPDVDGDGCPD